MPSAFAHAAVGGSLSLLLPGRLRSVWVALLFAALASAPDLDVIGLWLGIPYGDPLGHRGVTHSLLFAAAVGLVSWPLWRRFAGPRAGWAAVLTAAAVASHGLLDIFTDAGLGVGLLIPLDDQRFFAPFRPLMTSPLSVRAFFSEHGLAILGNELLFVGPVVGVILVAAIVLRRLSERDGVVRAD